MTSSRLHAGRDLSLLRSLPLWLCAVAAAFTMSATAHAASTTDDLQPPANAESMTPKQAYEHDKAYCNSQQATEARALCMKEANRAYQEDRAGKLEPAATASADDTAATPKHHRSHRMAKGVSKNTETSTSGTGTGSQNEDASGSSTGK